jgi:hypothetical protein
MTLRTSMVCGLVLALLGFVCASSPVPARGAELDLKLFGGYNYLAGGDLNAGTEGLANFWLDIIKASGWTTSGSYAPAHFGFTFGGDLVFLFSPTVGLAFGSEYLQASPSSVIGFTKGSDSGQTLVDTKASAVPLKVSLYVSIPSGPRFRTTLHVGVGYYVSAKMTSRVRIEQGANFVQYESTASSTGVGFHGGLGFEFDLSPSAALFIEARGRYAKFGGFSGNFVLSNSSGSVSESGKLYYEETGAGSTWYPIVMVFSAEPTPSSNIRNVREAKVDYSGAAVVGGLVIRF